MKKPLYQIKDGQSKGGNDSPQVITVYQDNLSSVIFNDGYIKP